MTAKRRWWWFFSGRRAILLSLLAVVLVALAFRWGDLALAYRLNSAERAILHRDFESAAAVLERAKWQGANSAQWHFLTGRTQRRLGRLKLAEGHFEAAERLGWQPGDLARQRLLAKAQSGQIKEVEAELVALLSEGASDEEAEELYEAMARGYLASFHLADANRCLHFWTEFQPDNPLPHLWQGELFTHLEDADAAAQKFNQVLELAPDNYQARLKLAQTQLSKLSVDEAGKNFEAALAQSPDAPEPLLGLVECRRRQGATSDAVSLLYDALLMDLPPAQSAAALGTLGRIDLEESRVTQAIHALQKSIQLDPFEPSTHLALASALAAAGEDDAAEAERTAARQLAERRKQLVELTRQAAADPANAKVRTQAGLLLMQHGRLAAGAEWLKTAVAIDPAQRTAHEGLAAYFRQIGDQAAARRHQALAGETAPATPPERKDLP